MPQHAVWRSFKGSETGEEDPKREVGGSVDEGLVAKRGIPVQRHTCALDLLISVTFLFIMGRLPSRKPQPPPHHQSHFPKAPTPAPPPLPIPTPTLTATFGFISNRSGCVGISRLGVSFVHV